MKRRPNKPRSTVMLAVATATAALLAACGDGGTDTATREDGTPMTTLTLASPTGSPIANIAFLPAGVEQGFFADEGVDLRVQYLKGGTAVASAVQADQADVALTTPEPMLLANAQGGDMKSIYQMTVQPIYKYGFVKGSGITQVEQLGEADIGVVSAGNIPTYSAFMNADLAEKGLPELDPSRFFAIGEGASAVSAVKAGRVDVLFSTDTGLVTAAAGGIDMDVRPMSAFASDFPGLVLMAKAGTIESKSDALAAMLRGYQRSVEFCTSEPKPCLDAFEKASAGAVADRALADAEWAERSTLYADHLSGENTTASWDAVAGMQRSNGSITGDLDVAGLFTNEILPKAP